MHLVSQILSGRLNQNYFLLIFLFTILTTYNFNEQKQNLSIIFPIKKIIIDEVYTFDLTKLKDWDSLKHLDFIMCIEKEFNIKIKVKNIFETKKLNDFCKMVKKNL